MSKPPVLHRQLDRCEVCGKKIHKMKLVRTNMDFLAVGGSNYLHHSTFTTDSWDSDDASDAGMISIGPYADESRVSISDSNVLTEINGTQTWSGSGTVRITYGISVSSWTSFVFSVDVGPYQQEIDPEITFSLGLCDRDGTNKDELKSVTTSGSIRAWFTLNVSDIPVTKDPSALSFYISADASGKKWWINRAQLEKDVSTPGAFIPVNTSGSYVDRVDTPMMTVKKVCPSCREPLLSKTERYNRQAEERTEDPVPVDFQEV